MHESEISREKAKAILAAAGRLEDWDPLDDYYLIWDDDEEEYLTVWCLDRPPAVNHTATSWASPGYPPPVRED